MYPRKIITKEFFENIINNDMTFEEFFNVFKNKCKYNKVTSEENTILREFQKEDIFITPEKAYKDAGIVSIKE